MQYIFAVTFGTLSIVQRRIRPWIINGNIKRLLVIFANRCTSWRALYVIYMLSVYYSIKHPQNYLIVQKLCFPFSLNSTLKRLFAFYLNSIFVSKFFFRLRLQKRVNRVASSLFYLNKDNLSMHRRNRKGRDRDRERDRQWERQTGRVTDRERDIQGERQIGRETDKERYWQGERQTGRETDSERDSESKL